MVVEVLKASERFVDTDTTFFHMLNSLTFEKKHRADHKTIPTSTNGMNLFEPQNDFNKLPPSHFPNLTLSTSHVTTWGRAQPVTWLHGVELGLGDEVRPPSTAVPPVTLEPLEVGGTQPRDRILSSTAFSASVFVRAISARAKRTFPYPGPTPRTQIHT